MRLALRGDCGATESAKLRPREHILIFLLAFARRPIFQSYGILIHNFNTAYYSQRLLQDKTGCQSLLGALPVATIAPEVKEMRCC